MSVTRYVTWSLHTKSRGSLQAMLKRVRAPGHSRFLTRAPLAELLCAPSRLMPQQWSPV